MIDILIPVLGRPANAQPLFDSVSVTREPHRLVFICSPRDSEQIAACQATGAETMVVEWPAGRGDYAKKINWAFARTESEWVFQGADDIRFSEGWDQQALMVARKRDKDVIGTNDLHNPAVKRSLQSTHTLFARRYIDEQGGTSDNTGLVFCELYDHQFIDTEFVETARRRRVWAFARNSIVEHLHPHWGLAEMDATYIKAYRATNQDYRLYMSRMGLAIRNGRDERYRQRAEARRDRGAAKEVQEMKVLSRFREYVDLVAHKDAEIRDLQRLALAANRASPDLAVAWSISLERPDVDIREDLDALIVQMSDQISQIEEHVLD